MWILTSFVQNELWVQLWTQFHSQSGCLKEYLWMTLGFCLPTNLSSESWSTPGPRFQESNFRPVWPSQRPPVWLTTITSHSITSLWQHLSPPPPFPLLYTGPIPQPVTQGHFASAQALNLRKTPFFQCPGLFMEPPKNNDSVPNPEELQSLKSTVEHQLTIGIKNWSVVSRVPEIST